MEKDYLRFNFLESTILVKLSRKGEEIIKLFNHRVTNTRNEDGYYELYIHDLIGILRYSGLGLFDIIDGSILISRDSLKDNSFSKRR